MIQIKLTRDEARAMQQYFFFYLEEVCQMKERHSSSLEDRMNEHIITDTFHQVKILFEKKLFNTGNNLRFKLTDTQAIILYKLLMNFPLDQNNIWLLQTRQLFCNIIYTSLLQIFDTEKKY